MNIPSDVKRVYLASPYSDEDTDVMLYRFNAVAVATAYLMDEYGYVVFSPIVHSHVVAEYLGNYLDHVFWLTQDRSHISTCDELWIYKLKGWDSSYGVTWETGLCSGLGKTIEFLEPDVVFEWATEKGITI